MTPAKGTEMTEQTAATFTDTDGETVDVAVRRAADWSPCVRVTARAGMTFDKAAVYVAPAVARQLAAALLAAADQADAQAAAEQAELIEPGHPGAYVPESGPQA